MRNVSNIRSGLFEYSASLKHLIVEVRSFPTLAGDDENNMQRNCSVLPECAARSTMEQCNDDCYSWPQSCLNFSSYSPETCTPPFYSPPMNVKAEISVVDGNVTDGYAGKLDLSWEPPDMNYDLFPVPNMYYVTIESIYNTLNLKTVEMNSIIVLPLNFMLTYYVSVSAYVPCSGLSQTNSIQDYWHAGCGYYLPIETILGCGRPTPPLHGWISNYQSTSLHSTVTFQCDSGWSPSTPFTTTCRFTDLLEWFPDPANYMCSGKVELSGIEVSFHIRTS